MRAAIASPLVVNTNAAAAANIQMGKAFIQNLLKRFGWVPPYKAMTCLALATAQIPL